MLYVSLSRLAALTHLSLTLVAFQTRVASSVVRAGALDRYGEGLRVGLIYGVNAQRVYLCVLPSCPTCRSGVIPDASCGALAQSFDVSSARIWTRFACRTPERAGGGRRSDRKEVLGLLAYSSTRASSAVNFQSAPLTFLPFLFTSSADDIPVRLVPATDSLAERSRR